MEKILIVSGNRTNKITMEVYDSLVLKTVLENNGYEADYIDYTACNKSDYYTFICEFKRLILQSDYDIIIFQSHWHTFLSNIRLAEAIKASDTSRKILFIGAQATHLGQAVTERFPFIDYVYSGEPENSICKAVDIIRSKRLDDLSFLFYSGKKHPKAQNENENIANVNVLPCPSLETINQINSVSKKSIPLNVGRGCPYGCTFCNICLVKKRSYRINNIDNIISDIKYYIENGIDNFSFTHDSFFVNQEKVLVLCEKIREENLKFRWGASGRIDNLSFDLIDKMYDCGLGAISFGIESGSDKMQKLLRKNLDLTKTFETVKYLRNKSIKCEAFFMYGFPEETEEDLSLTLKYALRLIDIGVNVKFSMCCFSTGSVLSNRYYNELFYNPENYVALKNVFGVEFEEKLIKDNKDIFSYLYDYNTEVRKKYKFLSVFFGMIQNYKYCFHYLNKYHYNENILKFYDDFIKANSAVFGSKQVKRSQESEKYGSVQLKNLFLTLSKSNISDFDTLKEIYRFETDVLMSQKEKKEYFFQFYNFDYTGLQNYQPLSLLKNKQSTLIILCKGNKTYIESI